MKPRQRRSELYPEAVMKYKVRLMKIDQQGYAVWVPGLPGCSAYGRTRDEALEKIKSALLAYLEALDEDESGIESSTVEI